MKKLEKQLVKMTGDEFARLAWALRSLFGEAGESLVESMVAVRAAANLVPKVPE